MYNDDTQRAVVELNIKSDSDLRSSKIFSGTESSALFRNMFFVATILSLLLVTPEYKLDE